MIRFALPALLIAGAVAAGLAVASEPRGAAPVRHPQVASVLSTAGPAAAARIETVAASRPWVSPKPTVMTVPVTLTPVAHAPRWVPLPPRRTVGL